MASTKLGDIPDARFHEKMAVTSVASAGANAFVGFFGPFAHPIRPKNLYFQPTTANQGANTASYRRLTLVNAGTAGTGTTVIGSINLTASVASLGTAGATGFVADSLSSVVAGAVLAVSQLTVGGADATGTVLQGGNLVLAFEVI